MDTIAGLAALAVGMMVLMWLWDHHYYFPFFLLLIASIVFVVATGEHPDYPIDVRH